MNCQLKDLEGKVEDAKEEARVVLEQLTDVQVLHVNTSLELFKMHLNLTTQKDTIAVLRIELLELKELGDLQFCLQEESKARRATENHIVAIEHEIKFFE